MFKSEIVNFITSLINRYSSTSKIAQKVDEVNGEIEHLAFFR